MRTAVARTTLTGMHDARRQATRILLVDRRGFSRSALAGLLRSISGVQLLGETVDGDALGGALVAQRPDVLIVDDRVLPVVLANDHAAGLRLIVVGVDDDPGYAARAARAGAEAWVEKDRAASLLPPLLWNPRVVSAPHRGPTRHPGAALGSER
ncbi:MAG TPA: hypothetical protein VKA57_13775 [Solirubrobacteraceae bacterium]|nr:hypothetical protein [Solirubrobacteraceae bacterium]